MGGRFEGLSYYIPTPASTTPRMKSLACSSSPRVSLKGSPQHVGNQIAPKTAKRKRPKAILSPKTKKKRKRKNSKTSDPPFWTLPNKSATTLDENSNCGDALPPQLLQFTIHGDPRPLRRHRTSGGFMYNPSSSYQQCFQSLVKSQLLNCTNPAAQQFPIWSSNHSLAVSIHFRMKRPLSHWVGSKRGPGRLRNSTTVLSAGLRADVDNLAKFVLDSLNTILYEDDRQVASLHVTKLYDSEDDCLGSTKVCLRLLEEDDMESLLHNSWNILSRS